MTELTKRLIVAAIGIPIALFVIYLGNLPFFLFLILVSNLALSEFFNLIEKKEFSPHKKTAFLFSFLIQVFFYLQFHSYVGFSPFMVAIFNYLLFVVVVFLAELIKPNKNAIVNIATTITGVSYVSIFFITLYILRDFDYYLKYFLQNTDLFPYHTHGELMDVFIEAGNTQWGYFIFIMFGSIWLCDSAAYFIGRKYGKHKLYPAVSPKKSIEGAVAGFVFAILGFVGLSALLFPSFPLYHAAVAGMLVGIGGQTGDLVESMLKRDADVKDSSNLLPGHGGVLDRFDSILYVSPILFLYLSIIVYFNLVI